jgi:hypothetical protein
MKSVKKLSDSSYESIELEVPKISKPRAKKKEFVQSPVVEVEQPEDLRILDQIRITFSRNWLAAVIGFSWGGGLPCLAFYLSHVEIKMGNAFTMQWGMKEILIGSFILGALFFSFSSVYEFGMKASNNSMAKAVGTAVVLEGSMVFVSSSLIFPLVALGFLVMINGINTAINLVVKKSVPLY